MPAQRRSKVLVSSGLSLVGIGVEGAFVGFPVGDEDEIGAELFLRPRRRVPARRRGLGRVRAFRRCRCA